MNSIKLSVMRTQRHFLTGVRKRLNYALFLLLLLPFLALGAEVPPASAAPEEPPLEEKLKELEIPENRPIAEVSQEKLYVVQNRLSPLKYRHEIAFSGGKNFTSDSFLASNQLGLHYRFYFSDRLFLGASGSYTFNEFTSTAKRLIETEGLFPDIAYVKHRADLMAGFHVFYGKLRLSMDQVFYFDQYVALGPGLVALDTKTVPAAVGDVGFVFWFGRSLSLRVGVKDYFFQEQRRLSRGTVHHLLGHFSAGYVFGG